MQPITATAVALCVFLATQVNAEELLRTTTSWDGSAFSYPPGQAEVTSLKLQIKFGTPTPFHCHPVPTLGHVRSGTVKVETLDGKATLIGPGHSVVELMGTIHRGVAIDEDVDILVFYVGARELPNTVLASSEAASQYCKPARDPDQATGSQ